MKGLNVLSGVRIVEQGTFITGPCTGMMLADLGADVIKIESLDGDPYRAYQGSNYSPHFQAYNRNKRSLALDLKAPADRAIFDQLLAKADVYIQNFRPGTADRLGAGPKRLAEINPGLVYCSISGFLSVVVDPERPRFLGPALADAITGIYAAYGVLGALFDRSRTGKGRLVEVSMLEAMAHFAVEPYAAWFALGTVPKSSDRPRLAQAHILRTSDGGLIAIHLSSIEKFWTGLVGALEAPELATDPRFETRLKRIDNYTALGAALDAQFSKHPVAYWVEKLRASDVPFAPINTVEATTQDPQAKHLGLFVPVENRHAATHAVRPAVQFDRERATGVTSAPLLNEQGEAIRAALAAGAEWPART